MNRFLAAAVFALGGMALARPASAQAPMPKAAAMENVEFQAQVVDLSCNLVYNLSGDMHRECAQVCADKGIPLGLLSSDGTYYVPVSTAMPGTGDNVRLKPFAEQKVRVKGKRIRRAGMNSIVIESITAA